MLVRISVTSCTWRGISCVCVHRHLTAVGRGWAKGVPAPPRRWRSLWHRGWSGPAVPRHPYVHGWGGDGKGVAAHKWLGLLPKGGSASNNGGPLFLPSLFLLIFKTQGAEPSISTHHPPPIFTAKRTAQKRITMARIEFPARSGVGLFDV